MKISVLPARRSPIFYGWFVVASCFFVTMTQGETMLSFGLFLKSLENEFDWGRAVTSSAYSAFLIGYALSGMIAGRLSDRYSPRAVLLISTLLAGSGLALSSITKDINQLRAFMLMSGLGSGALWSVPTSVVLQWFTGRPRAGMALALVTCGSGIGMIFYPVFINYLISTHGWRSAYLVLGIVVTVCTGLGSAMVKKAPGQPTAIRANLPKPHTPLKQIVFSPAFMAVNFAMLTGVFMFQSMSSHLVPFATDSGMSAVTASLALGLLGALSIPGRLIAGILADKVGYKIVLAGALFAMSAGIMILITVRGPLMLYSFVAIFGLAHGLRATSQTGILSVLFGTGSLGMLIGITMAVSQLVGIVAPCFCGFVYDSTGSYVIAFITLGVLTLAGALVLLRTNPSRAKSPAPD